MRHESFESGPSEWRVEAVDYNNEGIVYVAIFSGPNAKERSEEYAAWKNRSSVPPEHESHERTAEVGSGLGR